LSSFHSAIKYLEAPFPLAANVNIRREGQHNNKSSENTIGMNCPFRQPILYAALEDVETISLYGEPLQRFPPLIEECVRNNGREDSVGKFPIAMLVSPF
jgi:hypothetical protein